MSTPGEHEIETHPRTGRRMLTAGCIALGLFIIGLIAEAHADTMGARAGTELTIGGRR
jgi:hypothetical protein